MRYSFLWLAIAILWLGGALFPEWSKAIIKPGCLAPMPGDLIKTGDPSVWHVGEDGQLRYYPTADVFLSWHAGFSRVQTVSFDCFETYTIAKEPPFGINYPPGTLIKNPLFPRVYVVGGNNQIFRVKDEASARAVWGNNWNQYIKDVAEFFIGNYRIQSEDFDPDALVEGMVIKNPSGEYFALHQDRLYALEGSVPDRIRTRAPQISQTRWSVYANREDREQAILISEWEADPTQKRNRFTFTKRKSQQTPSQDFENSSDLSGLWFHDGGEKVPQGDVRLAANMADTRNRVWDGNTLRLFGAKNEVVSANLVLEAKQAAVSGLDVQLDRLVGPNGAEIASKSVSNSNLFDFVDRNIELFFVRYLEIKGLSTFCCDTYDERHIPEPFRRPYDPSNGIGSGMWYDRPDHNAKYPDILVPLELERPFRVEKGTNQSIWVDIYIPKNTPAGEYRGNVVVSQLGKSDTLIPVVLDVKNFTLPDVPSSKTMLPIGEADINERFFGERYPGNASVIARSHEVVDRYYQMAHRHKIALVDTDMNVREDRPGDNWMDRFDGSLYSPARGYAGPGSNTPDRLFVVGLYSSWYWKDQGQAGMHEHTNAWESWFENNAPNVERFLYLIDESHDYDQIETWARWMDNNPGIGKNLKSMATLWVKTAAEKTPSLDISASTMYVAKKETETVVQSQQAKGNSVYFYNGGRPGQGSFMIEDDGIALRELPWGQYKKGIDRWFYWSGTYYNNYQAGRGQTDLFSQAQTFGGVSGFNEIKGESGWNYSNGDGVLLYPGTDTIFPDSSYGIAGPIASIRLKQWRRGIQDVDYLTLAAKKDPTRTKEIVDRIVPKVLWEYGIQDPNDPSWLRTKISWSSDPDVWEAARRELAEIIE